MRSWQSRHPCVKGVPLGDAEVLVRQALEESASVTRRTAEECAGAITEIAERLGAVLQGGGTIYLCGNGGSAADAQHVAAELVSRYLRERRALPAVALTTDTSILSAIGNDYGFARVFARQVEALVRSQDALVGISTSGASENVLRAVRAARDVDALTVGFTGTPGEPLASECSVCLRVPSGDTPRIQETHIAAWHAICDVIERRYYAG